MGRLPSVSVVMVAAGEPYERLRSAISSLGTQTSAAAIIELVLALPPSECADMERTPLPGVGFPVRLVVNPEGRRAAGLNRALKVATGEVIARLDARSTLPPEYMARCLWRLMSGVGMGAVGGVQAPVAGDGTVVAAGIGRALANPWALGGAGYRTGRTGAADTVYLGVFWREQLLALGGWDERLLANEDYELCARLRQRGSVVWVEGDLSVRYAARSTLGDLSRQYLAFGRSKVDFWRLTGRRPAARQLAALAIAGVAAPAGTMVAMHRPRGAAVAAALGIVGMLTLDQMAVRRPATPAQRAAALLAYATIWGSWVAGIADGALRGGRR